MALGASVYKLVFDTQGLNNVVASRRELALSKKIMEETTPVVDKLAQAEANLDRLVGKGLITQDQRNQTFAKVKTELMGTTAAVDKGTAAYATGVPVIDKYTTSLAALGPIGVAVAAGAAVITAGVAAVSTAVAYSTDKITEQLGALDDLVKSADKVNILPEAFLVMSHAAELADISVDKFGAGFEAMLANVSRAASGKKRQIEAFDIIGLSAQTLKSQKPEEILERVTVALDGVADASDRIRAAKGIFGDADFLRFDTADMQRGQQILKDIGFELSALDIQNFAALDDAGQDLTFTFDSIWKKVAIELTPALNDAAQAAQTLLVDVAGSETFSQALDDYGAKARGLVVVLELAADKAKQLVEAPTPDPNRSAIRKFYDEGGLLGLFTKEISQGVQFAGEMKKLEDAFKTLNVTDRGEAAKSRSATAQESTLIDDEEIKALEKAQKAAEDLTASLIEQGETFGMTSRMAALYRSEMENNGRINVEGRQAAALLDQMDQEKKLRDDAAKATEDAAKKTEDAEKRRQTAITGTVKGLDDQLRKLELSEREQLQHALKVQQASEIETKAALDTFDKIQALEDAKEAKRKATEQKPMQARASAIRADSWEAAEEFARLNQQKVLRDFNAQKAAQAQVPGEPAIEDKGAVANKPPSKEPNQAMDRHSAALDGFVDVVYKWLEHENKIVSGFVQPGDQGGAAVAAGAPVGGGNVEQPAGATTITGAPLPSEDIFGLMDRMDAAMMDRGMIAASQNEPVNMEPDVISKTPNPVESQKTPAPKVEPAKPAMVPQSGKDDSKQWEKNNGYLSKIAESVSNGIKVQVEEVTL